MGVIYIVVPLDVSIAEYVRSVGGFVPPFNTPSRDPTPCEVRSVCRTMADLSVTEYSPPGHAWQIMIEGQRDPENEPWTLLNVTDFCGDESVPHAIWFEKGWASLILQVVGKLAAYCGPLVIVPDTGCAPVVVSAEDNVGVLFSGWEHTRGVGR